MNCNKCNRPDKIAGRNCGNCGFPGYKHELAQTEKEVKPEEHKSLGMKIKDRLFGERKEKA